MQTSTILISTFPPFPTLALDVPNETHVEDLPGLLASRFPHVPFHLPSTVLSSASGPLCLDNRPISSLISKLNNEVSHPQLISLRLSPLVMGGKGGFGSQLRAAGGRMSSQKTSNNDSCRDLNGRRISTVKQAQQLAEYVENEPARKKAAAEAQRAKLEALEKRLGIEPKAGSSSGPVAGQKHRFDDTEYLEQSKDLVDGVKSAVAAGLLKKRKKAKLSTEAGSSSKDAKNEPAGPSTTATDAPITDAPIAGAAPVAAAS